MATRPIQTPHCLLSQTKVMICLLDYHCLHTYIDIPLLDVLYLQWTLYVGEVKMCFILRLQLTLRIEQ